MSRKEKLLLDLNLSNQRGIEIGPLDKPMILKNESNIIYVDYSNTQLLQKKYSNDNSVDINKIQDIDIILSEKSLIDCFDPESIDYALASHVIEHIPDFIGLLKDVFRILHIGGVICLAVPDHRYTFDVFRRQTYFEDLEYAYERKATRPSLEQVLDHAKNVVEFDLGLAWTNYQQALKSAKLKHPPSNVPILINRYKAGEYLDVHCWIFTPRSFLQLSKEIFEQFSMPMGLRRFITTQPMSNEFFIQFEKLSGFQHWNTHWPKDIPCNQNYSFKN